MSLVRLNTTLDTSAFTRQMTALQKDQLPYGTALAINRITGMAQAAVQASLNVNFTLNPRKERFVKSLVSFYKQDQATKTKLEAKFGVNDPDSPVNTADRKGWILGRHQMGDSLSSVDPTHPFYIPTSNLVNTPFDNPPLGMYPKNLRLAPRRDIVGTMGAKGRVTRHGRVQLQGKRNTFVLMPEGRPEAWGIYRRIGAKSIEMIWAFRMHVSHKPRLHFFEIAERVLREGWPGTFEEAWDEAIRTAR